MRCPSKTHPTDVLKSSRTGQRENALQTCLPTACLGALTLTLAACAAPVVALAPTPLPAQAEDPVVRFDPTEVAYIRETGSASIEGQAVMMRPDGGIEPCHGRVRLSPGGTFGEHLVQEDWGNTAAGTHSAGPGEPIIVTPDMEAFHRTERRTTCDAEGRLRFDGLVDGDYFLFASVEWWEGTTPQGGHLMQRVRGHHGEDLHIIMSGTAIRTDTSLAPGHGRTTPRS